MPFIHAFGGVERLILELSRFLFAENLPHSIVCFSRTVELQPYADWQLPLTELRPSRNSLAEGRALSKYLSRARGEGAAAPLLFDLKGAFYAGMFQAGRFTLHLTDPPSLLPLDVSKHAPSARSGYPPFTVVPRPGPLGMLRAECAHRINRRGVRRASAVIAMTDRIADELHSLYGVQAHVVRPGVERTDAHRGPAKASGRKTVRVLSVSRLEPNKRIDWILRALAQLYASAPDLNRVADWTFEVVGDGTAGEELRELAQNLGLSDRVRFHGYVPKEELEEIYSRADLFIMTAVQGFGLPALEALSRGMPVILHKESGVSEILEGTPWVELISDGGLDLVTAVRRMVTRLLDGELARHPMPAIPSGEDWARQVSKVCNWI